MFDRITGPDFPLAKNRQIETGALAVEKALHHLGAAKFDAELEARHSRLRHGELRRADPEPISDLHSPFEEPLGAEVLAEGSPGKVHAAKLAAPVGVVLGRVYVHGFVGAAVHGKVRLPIAVQVELRNMNAGFDGALPDGRPHDLAKPRNVPWKSRR